MLRLWQKDCVKLAKQKFHHGQRHFLAQATPGAGKTIMAATLAEQMFAEKKIDFVLCFAPSTSVSRGIRDTFSRILDCSFKGKIGEKGKVVTYQSLRFFDRRFWVALSKYKVLCIFDEIHHCCGNSEGNCNSWGYHVLTDIQTAATYTLALSGTPWRSNDTPVALASYSTPDGRIVCDYNYSMAHAIRDKVCRKPTIALIDCEQLTVGDKTHTESFNSLSHFLSSDNFSYQSILNDDDALEYILSKSVDKLKVIREETHDAAGLVVASSIKHALKISRKLEIDFQQSVVVVTHKNKKSHNIINGFNESDTKWIVSVGMISEGTDIPRLQVCCYLTNVKTELYFRQVLGRILRLTQGSNQEAWFYTFSTPKMVEFAEDIESEIPQSCMYLKMSPAIDSSTHDSISTLSNPIESKTTQELSDIIWKGGIKDILQTSKSDQSHTCLLSLNEFNQRVIEAFREL
ncbi:DEAD/DEAH box helicase family protein [Vibrio astriarenae]|uniref:DEAD/DEAH box helicase family protein n=1 Tax=Vibrio astriarenae TaxID=1481923 RepID=A0A7Z2T0T0_9VIBR|nr:DEAD/DEAH box helicase family protein [Vibrio astriarenae]QIA62274.1 DEAD/DEAH box helicase family protein [Vibrio astriarenae]